MQRSILLAAGAVVVVVVGGIVVRNVTRHEAGQVLDRGVDQVLANLPPGTSVRHGATDYNPLTGSATVHDLAVTREGGASWTAETLTVSGADGRALQDVFDPNAYPNGRPAWTDRRLLIADVSATHVHGSIPGPAPAEFSADRLVWHRISGRPFAMPPTPANRDSVAFKADAALALGLDSETARGVSLTSGGPSPTKLTIGSADLSNYVSGKLGSAALKTIAIDSQAKATGAPVHLTIEGMDLKDADASGVLRALQRSGRADAAALVSFTYGAADLTGFAVQVPAGPAISLRDMHNEQSAPDSSGMRTAEGTVRGLRIALGETAVPPAAAPGLAAFGMTELTADIDVTSHGSTAAHALEFTEDLKLHDLGTLHVKGKFAGYDPAVTTPGAPMAPLLATTVERASIVWEDASLTGRLFRVAAQQAHTTPEMVRAQLALPLVALGVMVPDQPDAADQVTAFLNQPGKLTITMAPPSTVTVAEVIHAQPTARAHLLGLHITAN